MYKAVPFKRADRVAGEILRTLGEMLSAGEIKDPRLLKVSFTHVKLSDNLRNARVFFSMIGDENEQQNAAKALTRCCGFLKKKIGQRLQLRYTPEMRFQYDPSLEDGARMKDLLSKLHSAEWEEPMMIDQRDRVIELLDSGSTYLVVTHENPDGDAIGSALAMTLALRDRGKQATTYDVHGCPQYLRWLAGATEIVSEATLADYDVVCVLDCGEAARMGKLIEQLGDHPCVINIDHHGTNDGFGHANIVLPEASSSCEILFELFGQWGVTLTPDIATNLYVGIYTDTNMFKNMNSTPAGYHACGDLVAAGADFHTAAKRIYIETSAARLRLLSRILSTMQLDADGRIAGMVCTNEDLKELELPPDALESFVEYPRAIIGVEAAYLLRELKEKGQVKGSLRSTNNANVAEVAKQFSGGGHIRAAGFRATGTLADVRGRLVAALTEALEVK